MECDARQQVETLEKRLSAMETGNLFWPACGYCSSAGFLESVLEGKKAAVSIFALDSRDQKLFGFQTEITIAALVVSLATLRNIACPFLLLFDNRRTQTSLLVRYD